MKNLSSLLMDRSISFLQEDMNIKVINSKFEITCPKKTKLKENMAMIGLGGNINSLVCIGSDDILLDKIVEAFLEGEIINDKDLNDIRESVSCEVANIIIGNAITTLAKDSIINITPPIFIYKGKSLFKDKTSKITITTIKTNFGEMLISVIMSKTLLEEEFKFDNFKDKFNKNQNDNIHLK